MHRLLGSLPAEMMPEYWYGLEPNPKRKRIYLATDWERFVEEAAVNCTHGFLGEGAFPISAEGFVTRRGFAQGAYVMGKRDPARWREWLYPEGTAFPEP